MGMVRQHKPDTLNVSVKLMEEFVEAESPGKRANHLGDQIGEGV